MKAAFLSEFRKLITVKSSYFVIVIALALTALVGGLAMPSEVTAQELAAPSFLQDRTLILLSIVSLLVGITTILQFSHEYRFNTITYTLTSTRSRLNILLAKIGVASLYAVIFAALLVGFALLSLVIGIGLQDKALSSQTTAWGDLIWKSLFISWAYAMFGFILVGLARSQVFAIATFLAMPMIVEPLLGLALKDNAWYLPFMAVNSVTSNPEAMSAGKGALVVLGYILVGSVASLILFRRRDAN